MAYAKSEETRNRLLSSMSRLLRTQGYHATGISQVLADSGVPKGSLYYHFPQGKTELAATAVNRSNQSIVAFLQKVIDETSSPIDILTTFCDYYVQQMQDSNFKKGCPIATITLEAAATVDQIQAACKQAFDDMMMLISAQLQVHGVPVSQADSLAITSIAAIEGALILSRAQRDIRPLLIIRDNLTAQLQAAIAAGEAK